jgi:diguanylate cyclase (GGDEF)-like protein/PAS domain S-box-containing protein
MQLRIGPVRLDYILFFLLVTGVSLFLLRDRNLREMRYFQDAQNRAEAHVGAGLACQRRLADIVMENRFLNPQVAEILSAAGADSAGRPELRETLRQMLAADFQFIQTIGFGTLHFHLPDQTSFLRFHAPEKSGDRLATRTRLLEVLRTGERREGFEIHPLFTGYAFIYPVRAGGRLVGSVEVGIPLGAFQDSLNAAFAEHYQFLIDQSAVQAIAPENPLETLHESGVSGAFLAVEAPRSPGAAAEDPDLNRETIARVNQRIRQRAEIALRSRTDFSLSARVADRNYLVSFVSMKNGGPNPLLFLSAYREDATLAGFHWNMLVTLGMAATLLAFLMALHLWTRGQIREGNRAIGSLRRDLSQESQTRKAAEEERDQARRRLDALGAASMDALALVDSGGQVLFWNHAAEKIFGYSAEEMMGKPIHERISPTRMREKAQNRMEIFARTGEGRSIGRVVEMTALRKNGLEFPVYLSTQALRIEDRWWAAAAVRDITDQKRAEEQLLELQTTDNLTGLPNRSRFLGLLSREIARSRRYKRPLSLMLIDVDGFSRINRLHGRKVGDHLLRTLADLIGNSIRNVDISARLGDGEIGLLLTDTDIDQAEVAAERFRQRAMDTFIPTGGEEPATFTISAGVAGMDGRIRDVETFMNRAETALSQAKVQGRNCVVCAEKSEEPIDDDAPVNGPEGEHGRPAD